MSITWHTSAVLTLICASTFVLVSCDDSNPPMTNEQIIAEKHKCDAAGMHAALLGKPFDDRIRRVQCEPKS